METTFTIEQMQGMVGMTISRTKAKVTAVFDRKTGEGQYGPWSLQGGIIEDSHGGKMKVLFKQLPCQKAQIGRTLVFKSMEGKNGLNGVEVKKSKEYKGSSTIDLHVSAAALIIGDGMSEDVQPVQTSPRPPSGSNSIILEPKVSHQQVKDGMAMAKNRLTQLSGLYDLCWKTVSGMDLREKRDVNIDHHKDITTTLFIQSVREGLADKMPIRTTSKFYNENAIKPVDPKNPDMPFEQDPDQIPF